ncbi:MAG: hypothetical protein KC502_04220 [Myxococcales bacterium]|nr:hypothetical protein [Myxococcales bacterium]
MTQWTQSELAMTDSGPRRSMRAANTGIGRQLLVHVVACGLVVAGWGCGSKKKTPPPKPAAPQVAAPAKANVAAPKAVAPKPAAAEPKPAVLPPKATVTTRADSVALFFGDKGSDEFNLPTEKRPASVRVTPVDRHGTPITSLSDVAGSPLMLIAARRDLSWVEVRAPPKLAQPERATHTFDLTFPQAGAHMLLFAFQPTGAKRVVVPSFVNVQGDAKPEDHAGGAQNTWKGAKGLRAELLSEPLVDVCKPTQFATKWTRKGKPVTLGALTSVAARPAKGKAAAATKGDGAEAPHISYVILRPGLKSPQIIAPGLPAARLGKLPKETAAGFVPDKPGSAAILAVTRIGGKSVVARFDLVVGGKVPLGGCPK